MHSMLGYIEIRLQTVYCLCFFSDEKLTDVVAHVDDDNVVTATIWTKNETYHIEVREKEIL